MDQVLDAARHYLSHRPHSVEEVRRRLLRTYDRPLVEEAVSRLIANSTLDDAAFARFWLENRDLHRPKGAAAIRWELLRLGVSREVVDHALQGLDERESAYRAAQLALRKLKHDAPATLRTRLLAYLRRRGFPYEVAKQAVDRVGADLSDAGNGDVEGHRHQDQPKDVL